ncbi:hypothetical protein [Burkholderia gladioli]|uniref:hypothetical protein n=1 Tax=Burkholderia gladioli TaxID=28095 RepID=UPI00164115D7|nr:hypothetical protein [Burkholderia gladioli]
MRRHANRRDALAYEADAPALPALEATSSGFRQRLSTRLHARQYRHEKNWAGTRTEIAKLGLNPGSAMAFVAERGRRLTGAQGAVIERADQAMYATKRQRKDDDGSR